MCVEKLGQITVLHFSPHIFRHFRDSLVGLPDGFELATNYAAKSAGINPQKSGTEILRLACVEDWFVKFSITPAQSGMANSSYRQAVRLWKHFGAKGERRVGPVLELFEESDFGSALDKGFLARSPKEVPDAANQT